MAQDKDTSLRTKAAKAAAENAAGRSRRSLVRRLTNYAGSWWVWGLVGVLAVYLGFLYRPHLQPYLFEIQEGPGLRPDFPSPTRHFHLLIRDSGGQQASPKGIQVSSIRLRWNVVPPVPGHAGKLVNSEIHQSGEGEYLVAFRVARGVPRGHTLHFTASYNARPADSFVIEAVELSIPGPLHEPSCIAPIQPQAWTEAMGCPNTFPQVQEDLEAFPTIDLSKLRSAVPRLVGEGSKTSFLHYVIKQNQVFRKAYGPFPAFSHFADMVFHQLAAKVKLPDVEFLLNVGDWPLVPKTWKDAKVPVFSWCGSSDTFDLVLPQWDVSRSTILGNSNSNPDLLASQGWGTTPWEARDPRAAFRGRDSSPVRVKLAQLSASHPDLLDVAITSWENDEYFEVEEELGGGRKAFLKLSEFAKYKYILSLDGTVAAYRNPYMLASGSLTVKQDSPYYEWYQKELTPWRHFVPFDGSGPDLLSKLQWAKEHDDEAKTIANNARDYAKTHLLPERVLCYYFRALEAYAKKQEGVPAVTQDMIWVPYPQRPNHDTCNSVDPLMGVSDYPIIPLHPASFESTLRETQQDMVVIVFSSFCNQSARLLPRLLLMARKYKSVNADLMFASAETFSLQFPAQWVSANNGPKLFFVPRETKTPEQLKGKLTVAAAISFINSKLSNAQHHIEADHEEPELVSDPVPTKNDGVVKQVVAKNFDELVMNSNKDVLLMVTAPWCGHCKKAKPAYFRFARAVAASPSASAVLDIMKMNGTTNEIPHKEFAVTGYPTIWFIRRGEKKPIVFSGRRSEDGFLEFVKAHATEPARLAEVKVIVPHKQTNTEALTQARKSPTGSSVVEIDYDSFYSDVVDGTKDVLLLVYAPWCGHCKKLDPIYEEFGKLVADSKSSSESLVVAKMDGTANKLPEEKYKITGFPTVWFFKKGSDTPIKFMGERTTKGLASFVKQHAAGKVDIDVPESSAAAEVVSQPAPATNDGPVKVVVADTFKSMVLDGGKDVLLLVYAPWCGHCKKLDLIYEEFGKLVADSKSSSESLVVAKMDGTANKLAEEKYKVTGFPTVWFFKKGSDTPIKFMGERTTRGLASFVKQHAAGKLDIDVPESSGAAEVVSQPAPATTDGPVKVVVADTFKSMVLDGGKDVLLLVYAPWCGHCKKLDPIYEEFGKLVADSKSSSASLVVAKMDGTANKLAEEKYKVTGFPTVWFFKKGSDTPIKFMGERTTKGLASFVKQHAVAKLDIDVPESSVAAEVVSQPAPATNDGPVKVVVADTFKSMVLDGGKDVLLLVYAPWCGHCKKLDPIYEEFGKLVADSKSSSESLIVAKMDGTANKLAEEKYKVTGFPTVWFFKKGSDTPIKFMGERTTKGLASFVKQHAAGKLDIDVPESSGAAEVVSQPAPATNDGPVKVVVADTFKSMVLDGGKDVLLLVYAPWCGHCKKLDPIYEEFGKLVADSKSPSESLVVAKMDGTANKLAEEKYKVTGFPTVWFFKKGSDTPIKFMGERTTRGLASFVKQHAAGKLDIDVPESSGAAEVVSQPAPATNDGPVKVVVADTFKSMVLDGGKDVLLLVYAPWCGHCKKLDPIYEEFGKLVADSKSSSESLVVAKMDGTANKLPDEKYKVTGFPTVWFFKKGSDTPIKFMGERTTRGLASFVKQHAAGKLDIDVPESSAAAEVVSQPAPATNDGPVKVVVADTFKSMVLDGGKDVLLLVYAPWCGHCKKLDPIYEEFGKLVADSKSSSESLVVAKMDGTANKLAEEKYKVTGFPTVWFFKKGSDTPIKFMGERTTKGLASFVKQHASTNFALDGLE